MTLTPAAVRVLARAEKEARSLGHSYIGATHLVLGLSREGHIRTAEYSKLHAGVVKLTVGGVCSFPSGIAIGYTSRVRRILEMASEGGSDVTPDHILSALARHGTSVGYAVLKEAQAPPLTLEQKVEKLIGYFGLARVMV